MVSARQSVEAQAGGRALSSASGSPSSSQRLQLWVSDPARDDDGGSLAAPSQDGAQLPRTVAELWHYLQMGMQRVEVTVFQLSPTQHLCPHTACACAEQGEGCAMAGLRTAMDTPTGNSVIIG